MAYPSQPFDPSAGAFRYELTPFGKKLLGAYWGLWLLGLAVAFLGSLVGFDGSVALAVGPEGYEVPTRFRWTELVALQPPGGGLAGGPGFRWWQVLTASTVHPYWGLPQLSYATLGFLFFGAPVERLLGQRRFLQIWFVALAGAVLGAALVGPLFRPPLPHLGFGPAVLAIMLIHLMSTPDAFVPFAFVIQVRMRWIAAAVAVLALIAALALNTPLIPGTSAGGYGIGGMLAGFLWWRMEGTFDPRRLARRRRAKKLLRVVVDEALGEEVDDAPLFH